MICLIETTNILDVYLSEVLEILVEPIDEGEDWSRRRISIKTVEGEILQLDMAATSTSALALRGKEEWLTPKVYKPKR